MFKLLKEKGLTISVAESMTGGLLSYYLTKNPGASNIFMGSIVAYTKYIKINILKVKAETISNYSIVSKEVALEMAKGLRDLIDSNIYVSITGNAGPTFEENTNNLNCFIAILWENCEKVIEYNFKTNLSIKNMRKVVEIIENEIIKMI